MDFLYIHLHHTGVSCKKYDIRQYQENVRRKAWHVAAILLSSLLFGAVHIAHGFMYMVAAMGLLGALGGLYEKQRNILGVTVIHFVLGQAACCLGFLA